MLDEEARDSIRYLTLLKQKEQLEKEIEEIKDKERESKTGIKKENLERLKGYFRD